MANLDIMAELNRLIEKCDEDATKLVDSPNQARKDALIELRDLIVNWYRNSNFGFDDIVYWGPDDKRYDSEYGDSRMCECGHPYYRHFDSYDDMSPVGCKYCAYGEKDQYGDNCCAGFKEKTFGEDGK